MDYARFNYVAQPEDSVTSLFLELETMTYGQSNGDTLITKHKRRKRKAYLNEMTKEAYKNRRLWFGSSPYDPRYQTEDIGDNAMVASEYGIKT
jgi:hypothetical protein